MLLQILLNGLFWGSIYSLVALGLSLILAQARFINFSHGVIITIAPYGAFLFNSKLHFNPYAAACAGITLSAITGYLLEKLIFRKLRTAPPLVPLIASLGTYIVIQNSISMIFGDSSKSIRSGRFITTFSFLGATLTYVQQLTIIINLIVTSCLVLMIKRTRIGAAMRAITSDRELATIFGIDINRIILSTFVIASGLAGLAGIVFAFDGDMTPKLGMNLLLMGMAAVIFGGRKNLIGVMIGAYLLSLIQQLAVWATSLEWQNVVTFLALIIFLVIRPTGITGGRIRKANI
jgi:branched-chain amino acid transport system permease protein